MSTSPHMPQESFTANQIAAWLDAAERTRLNLHSMLAEPLYSTFREHALIEMSNLLKEALEEVRVISASLQENSVELCTRAQRLREKSLELQARSQSAQGPRVDAAQHMLTMFTPDGKRIVH